MPLVPTSVISHWFRKDSAVYRSFAFLFVNPLWQKPVPRGFSLCPYWWMAVLSFVLVRPAIYVLVGLRALIKGLHLERVIAATDWVAERLLPGLGASKPFGPTVVLGCLSLLATLFVLLIAQGVTFYATFHAVPLFVVPLVNLALLFECYAYAQVSECKTWVYTRLALVLSVLGLGALYPSEFVVSFVGFPIAGALAVFHYTGVALAWMGALAKGLFLWLAALFGGGAIGIGLCLGILVIAAVAGWIVDRFTAVPDYQRVDSKEFKRIVERLVEIAQGFHGPIITGTQWKSLVRELPETRAFTSYNETFSGPKLDAFITASHAAGWAEFHRMSEAQKARAERAARRAAACQRATAKLAALFAPVTAVLHNGVVLVAYLWALIKARKQGVCPYLTFTD